MLVNHYHQRTTGVMNAGQGQGSLNWLEETVKTRNVSQSSVDTKITKIIDHRCVAFFPHNSVFFFLFQSINQ